MNAGKIEPRFPRFRLTITYDYDADPSAYFEDVPALITRDVIQEMLALDEGGIPEIAELAIENSTYEATLECLGES